MARQRQELSICVNKPTDPVGNWVLGKLNLDATRRSFVHLIDDRTTIFTSKSPVDAIGNASCCALSTGVSFSFPPESFILGREKAAD